MTEEGTGPMTDLPEVTLDSLIGEHTLDAVDTFVERVKQYGDAFEDANAIRFRLDGIAYTATEDPSDGYRSYLGTLFASDAAEVRNVFPPVRVLARKKADEPHQVNDTLELIDVVTGKVVLEVGTDNTDDYYPSFVSAFWPENMATNASGSLKVD
jgi:hypothetical protein